jgi:hypothetical protein
MLTLPLVILNAVAHSVLPHALTPQVLILINERMDKLIVDARRTADVRTKRLVLYAEIESLVNEALLVLYIHHPALLEAGSMQLQGYQPAISGFFSTKGAGVLTAWLA